MGPGQLQVHRCCIGGASVSWDPPLCVLVENRASQCLFLSSTQVLVSASSHGEHLSFSNANPHLACDQDSGTVRTNKKNPSTFLPPPTPQTHRITIARVALAKKSTCSLTVGRCVGVSFVIWLDLSVVVLEWVIFWLFFTPRFHLQLGRVAVLPPSPLGRARAPLRLCACVGFPNRSGLQAWLPTRSVSLRSAGRRAVVGHAGFASRLLLLLLYIPLQLFHLNENCNLSFSVQLSC